MVPVYNVETYLAECLDSILVQPLADLEVVVVDDGSTDGSGRIAEEYARKDDRIRLVRQENAGLGAARNNGVPLCRGEYLTFVDSDDVLPSDAYTPLVETLDRTGSDLAVGRLKRFDSTREWASPRMRENHARDRLRTGVEEFPGILADVWAMNKVYRRSFWDAAGLAFPEGVRYEDQPTLTRAYLLADSFDVLRHTSYLWRSREDQSSITQRRHEIADLRDRVVTKRDSTETVVALGSPRVQKTWYADILPIDMVAYFRQVPGCSEEYWTTLRDAVREFWGPGTVAYEDTLMPVQQRLMGWLVGQDRRDDLEGLVAFLDEHPDGFPLEVEGDHVVAALPGRDDPTIPAGLFHLGSHEHRWEARLTSTAVAGDELLLDGLAVIRNVPTTGLPTTLTARLEGPGGAVHVVAAEPRPDARAGRWAGRPAEEVEDCGFRLRVPVGDLVGSAGPSVTSWTFLLERRVGTIRRGGPVTSWTAEAVGPQWCEVGGAQARLVVRDAQATLEVRPAPA